MRAFDYEVTNFESEIELKQDRTLGIKEKIEVNFTTQKHGIFRIIPYIYSARGKTIRAGLRFESVTDETGKAIPFVVENFNQSKKIKIGDAGVLVNGKKIYVISYVIDRVIEEYDGYPEIYWNVTGGEWDTVIKKARAEVVSKWATVTKADCFGGTVGTKNKGCRTSQTNDRVEFEATSPIGAEKDLTIVIQLDKNNSLRKVGQIEKYGGIVTDNWGYGAAVIPLLLMLLGWYRGGRDKRYLSENVYEKQKRGMERTVGIGERPHLPMAYSPINGLSPAEVGTVIDEKVDLKDVVAEIIELARLRYLKIEKTEKKKFLGKETDYKLIRLNNDMEKLNDYQKYLLKSIFGEDTTVEPEELEEIIENGGGRIIKTTVEVGGVDGKNKLVGEKDREVIISELKNKFYVHLEPLRKKIYKEMVKKEILPQDPRVTKGWWTAAAILTNIGAFVSIMIFAGITENGGPVVVWAIGLIPSLVLIKYMPRKTAWGYSLSRQAKGLKWYLNVGKWREEIAEKRLFLEEMLPLAIALGVVNKLAHDMEGLGVEPPSYFEGTSTAMLWHDLDRFSRSTSNSMVSAPQSYSGARSWSGHSSWSGGSGFGGGGGGGHSGGGFGGGGGGSW